MRVLINLYPVQSGGGQQVASNFIRLIAKQSFGHQWFVFVGQGSELHIQAKNILEDKFILYVTYSYLNRLIIKPVIKSFIETNKIDLIYNFAPVLPVNGVKQVVRSVYSNLYFPEIDFWENYGTLKKIQKRIIDKFRLKGTLKADGLIFENRAMEQRSHQLFNYSPNKTVYISPSITSFDESLTDEKYEFIKEGSFKILYLTSWYKNKNITILPLVALELKKRNLICQFVLTLNPQDTYIDKCLVNSIRKYNVNDFFIFIDKVNSEHVHQVIKNSNAMILLSKLECFSSNIIEAFTFKKPLIISNEFWAKETCKDAAIYVDRNNELKIADAIAKIINDQNLVHSMVEKGLSIIEEFNSPFEKIKKQVEFLEMIYNEH
jgi:glycosyltransferase involved in cell wall biosynthesis